MTYLTCNAPVTQGKNIDAIVRNLHSLGRVAQTLSDFGGPHLGAKLATKTVVLPTVSTPRRHCSSIYGFVLAELLCLAPLLAIHPC